MSGRGSLAINGKPEKMAVLSLSANHLLKLFRIFVGINDLNDMNVWFSCITALYNDYRVQVDGLRASFRCWHIYIDKGLDERTFRRDPVRLYLDCIKYIRLNL